MLMDIYKKYVSHYNQGHNFYLLFLNSVFHFTSYKESGQMIGYCPNANISNILAENRIKYE